MVRPFNIAWSLLKSRTLFSANRPSDVRQRVPLVGAQRVDENFAERSDDMQPRRHQEQEAMMRDMAADKPPMDSFEGEEEGVDEHSDLNDFRNQQALEEMLSNIRTREITNPQGHGIPPTPSPEQLRSTAQRPPPAHSRVIDNSDYNR